MGKLSDEHAGGGDWLGHDASPVRVVGTVQAGTTGPAGTSRKGLRPMAILHTDPEQMTVRARLFLTIVAVRNISLGISMFTAPFFYAKTNQVFDLIRAIAPIEVWGWIMLLIGLAGAHSAVAMSRTWAKWAINTSATLSTMWAVSLLIQFVLLSGQHPPMSPMLPILWAALTAKDFVIAYQPMRSPLEGAGRRLLNDERLTHAAAAGRVERADAHALGARERDRVDRVAAELVKRRQARSEGPAGGSS
jgi:hypothetical protein